MATLTPDQQGQLAHVLRERREQLGISAREVARRANLNNGTIHHLENATNPRPSSESLTSIAEALELPAADLLAIANRLPTELPTFKPYLRSKYHELPEAALNEMEDYFRFVQEKHHASSDGPTSGEDE